MAWFKSIQDIHNRLRRRTARLSLQVDVTATPRHNNGAIFVQTVADYPLVEAIHQNVVKHPCCPTRRSRAKLRERQSAKFTEKYADYLHLGVSEWRKAYARAREARQEGDPVRDDRRHPELRRRGGLPGGTYPDLQGRGAGHPHQEQRRDFRSGHRARARKNWNCCASRAARSTISTSPYKAIVSVLMLREGWDVRNVTTIVGLRAYAAKSNILPEQTLGRGLRRMFRGEDVQENVSVVGTDAFMDFVESIQAEGVVFEYAADGRGHAAEDAAGGGGRPEQGRKDIERSTSSCRC